MRLVVGLGNPGKAYQGTRHNVGFDVVDRVAAITGASFVHTKFQSEVAAISDPVKAKLARPTTYMNLSGRAVKALIEFYEVPLESLLVICDDIDLNLGVLRVRRGGGSGGQNGLRSIAEQLGTQEFPRMRLGIPDCRLPAHQSSLFLSPGAWAEPAAEIVGSNPEFL